MIIVVVKIFWHLAKKTQKLNQFVCALSQKKSNVILLPELELPKFILGSLARSSMGQRERDIRRVENLRNTNIQKLSDN